MTANLAACRQQYPVTRHGNREQVPAEGLALEQAEPGMPKLSTTAIGTGRTGEITAGGFADLAMERRHLAYRVVADQVSSPRNSAAIWSGHAARRRAEELPAHPDGG